MQAGEIPLMSRCFFFVKLGFSWRYIGVIKPIFERRYIGVIKDCKADHMILGSVISLAVAFGFFSAMDGNPSTQLASMGKSWFFNGGFSSKPCLMTGG